MKNTNEKGRDKENTYEKFPSSYDSKNNYNKNTYTQQTNVNTFQVIALVGECSVRVVEVYPDYTTDDAYGMAEDRTYKYDRSKIAPIATRSIFVDDCVKGDLHRVCEGYNGKPYIGFEKGYYHAYLVETDTAKHYVSWYH